MNKTNFVLKKTVALTAAAALAFSGTAQSTNVNAAKKVKVSKITVTNSNVKKNKLTIKKGEKVKLKVKVTPKKASNKKVKFKSSNKKIVTVSSKGVLKGVKNGKAKVTITAKDGSKKKYVLNVTVKKKKSNVPAVTETPAPSNNPSETPVPSNNPSEKPSTTPAVSPTIKPATLVKVDGEVIVAKTINTINNSDFTVTVKAELENGKKLSEILPNTVKTALNNTKITLTNEKKKITLTADYVGYSNDSDTITYQISSEGQNILQPSKNNGDIGSMDGQYLVESKSLVIPEKCYVSYSEALVGNSLSGYIYDKKTKLPMKNAKVTAYTSDTSKTITTDEHGYYSIPLTSASYSVKAEAADTSNYFSTNENGKISRNNKTGCNMFIEQYNREELFINGIVKSNTTNEPLKDAVVSLYKVNADQTETLMATVTTDKTGLYMFKNSQASQSDTYKDVVRANGLSTDDINQISRTFAYKKGLDREENYKIVIKKELSKTNITDVYEPQTYTNIKFDSSRQKNMNTTTLKLVERTKNMSLNVKWTCDLPKLINNKTNVIVKFCYKNDIGRYEPIISKKVSLSVNSTSKQADEYDLAAKNYFDESLYPTLPTGKYYVIVDDGNEDVSAVAVQEVDVVAGKASAVKDITISDAKSTSIATKCSVLNQVSVSNFVSGKNVYVVSDTKGTLDTSINSAGQAENKTIKPSYKFFQAIGDDLIYISTASADLKYESAATAKIEATTGLARTAEGATYTIIPTQSYIYGENSFSFTQSNQAISEKTYSCAGAANIDYVKIKAYSQFRTEDGSALSADDIVAVDNIKLLDENNNEMAVYNCKGKKYKLSDLKNKGIEIPDKETGFKGLVPSDLNKGTGRYKIVLDLVDYEPVTETVSVTDFQSVTVTESENINFTQKTKLYGTLSVKNSAETGDVQDSDVSTVDAVLILYDKDDKVVGAATYGDKKSDDKLVRSYSFVNGENAYLEGGEYTLVVRGTHHNDTHSFETYIGKVTIASGEKNELNLDLQSGSNGSITLSVTDENNNYLENGDVTLYDEKSLNLLTFQYVPGYNILETLSSLDPTLLGIFNIKLAANSNNEWKATECIPKGTYTPVITSDKTVTTELNKITLSSGQHYVDTGVQVPLIAGKDEVKLTIKYAHQLDADKKAPFEMICVYNSSGKLVAYKPVFDTISNTSPATPNYNTKDVYIPNVADTYKVVIFSNGSFLSNENVAVQGTSKTVDIKLAPSSIN